MAVKLGITLIEESDFNERLGSGCRLPSQDSMAGKLGYTLVKACAFGGGAKCVLGAHIQAGAWLCTVATPSCLACL
eukprot:1143788-Pelagomonas_calceolata.AAC.1